MNVPTEPGLYWARVGRVPEIGWTVVELHEKANRYQDTHMWVDVIGWDAGELVRDDCWGPKLEVPQELLNKKENV